MNYRSMDEMIVEAERWSKDFITMYLREMNGDRESYSLPKKEQMPPEMAEEVDNAGSVSPGAASPNAISPQNLQGAY